MKILFSCLLATVGCFGVSQTQNVDLSNATYSGYDRNLSFSVDLGYRGSYLVSGTNVKLKPSAAVSPEPGAYNGPYPWTSYKIVEFKVYVQEPVCGGSPDTQGYQRLVSFASTRFEDNQEVLLRLHVTFELESEPQGYVDYKDIEVSVPVKVFNKGSVYALEELENSGDPTFRSVATVEAALRAMNHTVLVARGDIGWNENGLLQSVRESTAFYVNSHGSPRGFRAQDGLGGLEWINPGEVAHERDNAAGPPMNFAFVDSCKSGTNDNGGENHGFSMAFLRPFPSGLPNGYEGLNRAEMGWLVLASASWAKPFNQTFWAQLQGGQTVSRARDTAMRELLGEDVVPEAYLAVYGDYYTRLMTVYTGNDDDPIGWFKVGGLETVEPGTFGE